MNYRLEWGVTPANNPGIDPVVLESLDIEAKNLSQAKGQAVKLTKACPKVIDYFSSETEDWDASESRWQDWEKTADHGTRLGWKYVSRQSEDLCVKPLIDGACRVFIMLSWQDPKASKADAKQEAPLAQPEATQEAPAEA